MHREDEPDIDFIKNELDPEEHHKNDVIDRFLKGIRLVEIALEKDEERDLFQPVLYIYMRGWTLKHLQVVSL
jgi:hypothetical protein